MDIKEFKKAIKKVSSNRKHSVKDSYGVRDALAYFKKNKPGNNKDYMVTDTQYGKLIREVNKLIIESLFETGELVLPLSMGKLRIYKRYTSPKIIKDKLYYSAPIDWNKTLELWAEDPESKVSKVLVRSKPGVLYSIRYNYNRCRFKNKEYLIFKPNRSAKISLKDKVNRNEDIISFNFYKNLV